MELASRLAQQQTISRVLYQGMLEQITRVRRHTLPEQQTCPNDTVEFRFELCLRLAGDSRQQGMREFASNRRPDLSQLLGGTEPVEPRHKRCMQARRDCHCRRGNQGRRPLGLAFACCLQHRLCHLLHEQGDAVGALDDVLPDIGRQRLVPDDVVDQGADFTGGQRGEGEGGHMRLSDPGRLEFRPERHDEQRAEAPNPVNGPTEHFQAGGVGPMRILEDDQHRTLARQGLHLRDERVQRSFPALLGCQFERGIASIVRQRQHLGQERGVLRGCRGLSKEHIELVEFRLRGIVVHQAGSTFHLSNGRMKCAVGVLRRAETAQARVRLAREKLHNRGRKS